MGGNGGLKAGLSWASLAVEAAEPAETVDETGAAVDADARSGNSIFLAT